MSLIAATYLVALVDARTPLLVADDLGVRIRLGHEWRGLPWEAIGQVVVHPRRGLLRDGRLVVSPHTLARALDGVAGKARRQVVLNQKMYGAPLAVPLGATTRLSVSRKDGVADAIAALSLGRADVVELDSRTLEVVDREARAAQTRGAEPGETAATEPAPAADPTSRRDGSAAGDVPVSERATGARDVEGTPSGDDPAEAEAEDGAVTSAPQQREVFPRVHDEAPWGLSAAEDLADSHFDAADASAAGRPPRRSMLGGIGTIVSRVAKGRSRDLDGEPGAAEADSGILPESGALPAPAGPAEPSALRETRPGLRAEATLAVPTAGDTALDPATHQAPASDGRELHRPGSVDLVFEPVDVDDRVRPISTLGEPVEPLVIGDYATEPAYDPVIGPELTAARTRLGLSVDDLAERTRIRPHVIESIEVDDFAPCGGDFYARGHLRTLARILGKNPEPLLRSFEERYATAPINARRVFEAELATGMTGSMRSTVGGPSWSLLLGVALALILVWGVLRLFTGDPVEPPTPMIQGAVALLTASTGGSPGSPV